MFTGRKYGFEIWLNILLTITPFGECQHRTVICNNGQLFNPTGNKHDISAAECRLIRLEHDFHFCVEICSRKNPTKLLKNENKI